MATETPSIITSVQPTPSPPSNNSASALLPSRLLLLLRGTEFELTREQLVELPESILIVMFPNGVVLSRNPAYEEYLKQDIKAGLERCHQHIVHVDFNPDMLKFVLDFYKGMNEGRIVSNSPDLSRLFGLNPGTSSPFTNKKPFIVLREELDYFSIPFVKKEESSLLDSNLINSEFLKTHSKEHLLKTTPIFLAFERNIHGGSNLAEKQLVDMLCLSGFKRDDVWGYRACEPNRATLVSIALVPLLADEEAIKVGVTQKLLLFWRKPARKCWWDIETISLSDKPGVELRLWSRRIWTLELALA